MAVEIQENGVWRAPLIFIVPACGFVVATRTKQFQVRQNTREEMPSPGAQGFTADPTREINPQKSLRQLRRKTASLKSGKVELPVFLFFGFVAVIATVCSFGDLFHLLGNGVLEQAVRALLTT